MILLVIVFSLVALTTIYLYLPYWRVKSSLQALQQKGYKTPHLLFPANPLMGQSRQFRANNEDFITDIHKKHGKNVGFFLQNQVHFSIDMKDYMKDFFSFPEDTFSTSITECIFPLSTSYYFINILRTIHPSNLKANIPATYRQLKKFLEDEFPLSNKSESSVQIKGFCYRACAVYNLWTFVGLDYDQQGPLIKELATLYKESAEETNNVYAYPLFTPLWRFRLKKYGPIFEALLRPIIKQRRQELDMQKDQNRLDFLAALFNYKDEYGELLSDERILNEIFTILQAAGSVAFSMLDILEKVCINDKSFLLKIEEEQENVIKEHGRDLDWSTMSRMPYFDKVIQETLRLEFTLTCWRCANTDVIFSDGLAIPKGTFIIMTMLGFNLDEENYPEATTWNPERFIEANEEKEVEGEKKKNRYPFLWGSGKLSCAGRVHAQSGMKMFPVLLFRDYHVRLTQIDILDKDKDKDNILHLKPKH